VTKKLLALLFAGLLALGGTACTVNADDDDAEGTVEVEDDAETEVEVEVDEEAS